MSLIPLAPFIAPFVKTAPRLTSSFLLLTFLSASAETSPSSTAGKTALSVESPSVQSAIVAAVENDRKRYGGHTPVPATLIGVWDGKGGSFIRAFGDADLEKKVPLTPADHFRIGSNTKTFVISVLLQLVGEKKLSLDDPLSHFSAGRYHTECRKHHRARALQYAQRPVRSLRYPGVRAVEYEGPERLQPAHARRMGDEAETIFSAGTRLSTTATPTICFSG